MFKYKKITIYVLTILFTVLSLIELAIYLFNDNTIFGLYYLLINLLIIFLLIPCAYNFKRYYSVARISKLIIIILLGIFNSYILKFIIFSSCGYIDDSVSYLEKIFIIKNILKGIIYIGLAVICFFEFKNKKLINNK